VCAVLGVFVRALLDFYRRQARRCGVRAGHTGTLTVIQRFGGGLNPNVHFHTLVLDGVFRNSATGSAPLHPASPPSDEEVARLLATIRFRVRRLLRRRGLEGDNDLTPPDSLAEESVALAAITSASVAGGASRSAGAPGRACGALATTRRPSGSPPRSPVRRICNRLKPSTIARRSRNSSNHVTPFMLR